LPHVAVAEDKQLEELAVLETENRRVGLEMERAVEGAETLLNLTRSAIRTISDDQNAYLKHLAQRKGRIVEAGVVGVGF